MSYELAYIGAAQRSGSTLLDRLLSSHSAVISVGEVHYLRAYALDDRRYYSPKHPLDCSCGQKVSNCEFWVSVQARLGVELASLKLKPVALGSPVYENQDSPSFWQNGLAKLIYRQPLLYRNSLLFRALGGPRVGADSFALFDAIAAVTNARRIIDSSKNPFRFYALYQTRPEAVRLMILCRDYRAVAHSYQKRGVDIIRSTRLWTARLRQLEQLAADIEPSRVLRVRYEDLCADTNRCLNSAWAFLGLDPGPANALLSAVETQHHLGGSPSKFSATREVRLDRSYQDSFSESELRSMRAITGTLAADWGYE